MAMPQSRARQQRAAREGNAQRWALWRQVQERRLHVLREKLQTLAVNTKGRVCERCGKPWYATEQFFKPRPKRRNGKVIKVYLSRTCRICSSKHSPEFAAREKQVG